MNEVKYLGIIAIPDGTRPHHTKVEAIIGMPTTTDKASVGCLLGMINFLAAHVPDMPQFVIRCDFPVGPRTSTVTR